VKPLAVGITSIWMTVCPPAFIVAVPGALNEKPSTVKVETAFAPPPVDGFVTVTFTLPIIATSAAGMAAEILVALSIVASSVLPLKLTTEFEAKFVPVIFSLKAVPPGA
jgi:hypothetical protein